MNYRRALGRLVVSLFAVIGAFLCISRVLHALLANVLFETQVVRTVTAPAGAARAEIEVRRGGLGTVWTTRVHLIAADRRRWTIYQTGDSSFQPPLRWEDRQTLVVGLPCDRFGYASNPDDWDRHDPAEPRLRVRFEYPAVCRATG